MPTESEIDEAINALLAENTFFTVEEFRFQLNLSSFVRISYHVKIRKQRQDTQHWAWSHQTVYTCRNRKVSAQEKGTKQLAFGALITFVQFCLH